MNSIRERRKSTLATSAVTFFAALVILAAAAISAQAQTVNFPSPSTFQTATPGCQFCPATVSAATGDFNGDGKLDAVNLDSANNLNVMLGNGDGTFKTPVTLAIGSAMSGNGIAVGDFNGDHLQDVAVWGVAGSNMQVQVFLGNGTGTLTPGGTFSASNSSNFNAGPSSIVATDLNGDGKLDLAAVTTINGVFVFLGNGDGTFQTAANYSSGTSGGCCQAIAVGDVNGDGKADLAVSIANGMSILINNGSGAFATGVYYPSGVAGDFSGDGIAVGDLNGDKKLDVVVTEENGGFIIFLNQGTGTFAESSVVSGPFVGATNNIVLADINRDTKLDALLTDMSGNAFAYLGTGKGTFTAGPFYPLQVAASGSYLVVLGDFNGDGTLDLWDTNGSQSNTVSLGRGDGSFRTAQGFNYTSVAFTGHNVVAADFNGDGIQDVAYSLVPLQTGTQHQSFAVLLGTSHGVPGTPSYIAAGSCTANQTNWIATGDVNGDGKADIVATMIGSTTTGCQNNKVAVLTGLGTGKFSAPKYYSTGASSSAQEGEIYLVDVNGDGKLDIVTSNSDGTISVLTNKGTGTYNPGSLVTSVASLAAFYNPLAFGDFTGDGKMDIAVVPSPTVSNTSSVQVLPGNGNGTFGALIQTLAPVPPVTLASADFNKDGKADVVVTMSSYSGCSGGGYTFLKGNGNGTFTPGTPVCLGYTGPGDPQVADLNADGTLDLVIPYAPGTGTAIGPAILQGNGDGTFKSSQLYYTGQAASNATIADFNGDGNPDVMLINDGGFGVSFLSEMLNASQKVSVSPLTQNFGSVTVGSTKNGTIILTNNQSAALSITSVTVGGTNPGDFPAKTACKTSVKAGWDCTTTITFTPAVTGARSATLSIKDGVGTQTVQLNGTGK